jgi:hypothetical protein
MDVGSDAPARAQRAERAADGGVVDIPRVRSGSPHAPRMHAQRVARFHPLVYLQLLATKEVTSRHTVGLVPFEEPKRFPCFFTRMTIALLRHCHASVSHGGTRLLLSAGVRRLHQWCIMDVRPSTSVLACCTSLSHWSTQTTARTDGRPQSNRELEEDGPG